VALSVLALTLPLVVGTTSRAETPDKPPSGQPSELTLPPFMETAKCKDNDKLYVRCDRVFKAACAKRDGKFLCDNPDCSEGTCFLPED
jgi:hypothetical protein